MNPKMAQLLTEILANPELHGPTRSRIAAGKSVLERVSGRCSPGRSCSMYDIDELLRAKSAPQKGLKLLKSHGRVPSTMGSARGLELVWKRGAVNSVFVHGTWSEPAWMERIELARDPADGYYKVDLSDRGLSPGTYIFKFVVDGHWCIDPSLPTRSDLNGHLNNTMFVRSSVRPLKTVKSAPTSGAFDVTPNGDTSAALPQSVIRRIPSILGHYEDRRGEVGPHERQRSGLALICGAWMIPHPEKVTTGGADSFFACSTGAGVADGVGEWEWRFKLDPRKFAEQLMEGCLSQCHEGGGRDSPAMCSLSESVSPPLGTPPLPSSSSSHAESRALRTLEKGFESAHAFGSATACVLVMDEPGERIGVANLGDSGMIHFRRQMLTGNLATTCVMRTKEQQHAFNMPYQLSRLPSPEVYDEIAADPTYSSLIAALRTLSGRQLSKIDQPTDAELYAARVREGDLIILGTDGVLDNLWNYDLLSLVSESASVSPFDARMSEGAELTDPEHIARTIAVAAFEKSMLESGYKSPFGVECRKRTGAVHRGGKMDDITVVACWVARAEDAKNSHPQTCRDWWRTHGNRVRNTSTDELRRLGKFEKF